MKILFFIFAFTTITPAVAAKLTCTQIPDDGTTLVINTTKPAFDYLNKSGKCIRCMEGLAQLAIYKAGTTTEFINRMNNNTEVWLKKVPGTQPYATINRTFTNGKVNGFYCR